MERQYRVLVADDSAFARKVVKMGLADSEFCVGEEARTGLEALELSKKSSFDLVLLDVIMPDMDGSEALKGIVGANPDMIVIMLSSMGSEEMVTKCLTLGAKTFVQKPFDKDVLLKQMRQAVAGRKDVSNAR